LRAEYGSVVLCDAGDFYDRPDPFKESQSHLVAELMGHLGYDAIGVGEMDLNFGLEKLREDVEKYGLNVTCANLISKEPAPKAREARGARPKERGKRTLQQKLGTVFPPYLVVEREGVRVGFVALLSPQVKIRGGSNEEVEALTYIIKDPAEMAAAVLPKARSKCDVLVLLAHMDEFELGVLLPNFPQVDLVVLGHNPRSTPMIEPIQVGTVTAYRATPQGQCIGHLQIALDAEKRIVDAKNQVHFLDANIPDDPGVAGMLDSFDEENRKAQKLVFAKEQLKGGASSEETGVYLGVGTCMGCHPEAFEAYTRSGHARAYRTLAAESVQRDTRCVGCHVTGYGERGGFSGVRRMSTMVDLIDVQCEACHGAGSNHSRDGAYREAAKKSCVRCHTNEEDSDFDFDEDWSKIAH
jgi:hypothetical protein